jgi:hypothetical protein
MDDVDYGAVQRARKSQAKEMEERQRQMDSDFAKAMAEFERKQQNKPSKPSKPLRRSKIMVETEEEPMEEVKMEMPKQSIKQNKKEPKKQVKKAEEVKEIDHSKHDIRTHLKTLTWMELKNLAKITNLHFHISLKSKSNVIEGLAKLYEFRNGVYTTKPFEAIQKDGKTMKKPIQIKKKISKTSAIDASLEEWAKQFEK